MSILRRIICAILVAAVTAQKQPPLFGLEDYEECTSNRTGSYCLGSFNVFEALPNNATVPLMENFSENKDYFDRLRLHRGICISRRCPSLKGGPEKRFAECAQTLLSEAYNVSVQLSELEYCKVGDEPAPAPWKPIDMVDFIFASIVGILLVLNIVGTLYDLLRNPEDKANPYLSAWSVIANWKRLTACHRDDGDPRLSSLNQIHGIKTLTLMMVIFGHTIFFHYRAYLENPNFLEEVSRHPLAAFLHNGTVIVQTFIVLTSFLLGYNLLLRAENNPMKFSITTLLQCLLERTSRVTPIQLVVVGATATWLPRVADGALWAPLFWRERDRCRRKWWTQALYLNNLLYSEDKCLIPTWYLAVDMQLYAVAAVLTLIFTKNVKAALKTLALLFISSIAINFLVAYNWNLKAMLFITHPEILRSQFNNEPSFTWLYSSPWSSLPASLAGLFLAFLYHHVQQIGFKPHQCFVSGCQKVFQVEPEFDVPYEWMRAMHRSSIPCMLLWIFAGYWVRDLKSREAIAVYAALDRSLYAVFISAALFGFFTKIDYVFWQFLSWRLWQIPSRMSLSIFMVHWSFCMMQIALGGLLHSSLVTIIEQWAITIGLSYVTSLPLYLLVESPARKFFKILFLPTAK